MVKEFDPTKKCSSVSATSQQLTIACEHMCQQIIPGFWICVGDGNQGERDWEVYWRQEKRRQEAGETGKNCATLCSILQS